MNNLPRRVGVTAAIAAATLVLSGCPAREHHAQPPTPAPTASEAGPQTRTPEAGPSTTPGSPRSPQQSPRQSSRPAAFPSALRGQDIEQIPTRAKIVALTFDAGANADGLDSILATLDVKNVKATFFLTGDFADAYAVQSRRIAGAGHRLANHTVNHPHLPVLGSAQVRSEVLDAERKIRAAAGANPKPFFRFPYGDRSSRTIEIVNDAGYACVRWTVDTLGWKGTDPGGQTAQTVTRRVIDAAIPGEIVLMHVGSNPDDHTTLDADALLAVIDGLRVMGYSFVTLDVLL